MDTRVREGKHRYRPVPASHFLDGVSLPRGIATRLTELSPREQDIFRSYARNWTYKGVSYDLGIVEATIKNLVSSALRKLDCASMAEAVYKLKEDIEEEVQSRPVSSTQRTVRILLSDLLPLSEAEGPLEIQILYKVRSLGEQTLQGHQSEVSTLPDKTEP